MKYGYSGLLIFGAIVIAAYIRLVNKVCENDVKAKYSDNKGDVNVR